MTTTATTKTIEKSKPTSTPIVLTRKTLTPGTTTMKMTLEDDNDQDSVGEGDRVTQDEVPFSVSIGFPRSS